MSGVCAVMLVKDEQDVIEFTVRHLATQVDYIIVADNLSSDGTRKILDLLVAEGLPVQVVDDPEVGYFQDAKTTDLAMHALRRGFDWVLPCDADEFWYATDGRTISQFLNGQTPDVQIVTAELYNHLPTALDLSDDDVPSPFGRIGWRKRERGALGKVCCRTRPDLRIHMGNHSASVDGVCVRSSGLCVRHFSWRSAEQYCNPPEAPIWMADLSFRPLGDVRTGDEVIGWGYSAARKKVHLRPATVLATGARTAPIVRVEFESGRSLRCTPDHLWRQHHYGMRGPDRFPTAVDVADGRGRGVGRWTPGDEITVGDAVYARGSGVFRTAQPGRSITRVVDPTIVPTGGDDLWLAGWLGGMFDGEGHRNQIAQSRAANPIVYEAICSALDHFGLPYSRSADRISLTGGRQTYVDFANIARPRKRTTWVAQQLAERGIGGKLGKPDTITTVTPDGSGEVISLTTSTGNYVAWGYASKNCRKIRNGEKAYAATSMPENIGLHWRMFAEQTDEDVAGHFRQWFWSADPYADDTLIFDPAPGA